MVSKWTHSRRRLAPPPPGPTGLRTPSLQLLREVLIDLFAVRDCLQWYTARARKPPRRFQRQYERDLQWVSAPDDQFPFSFAWVCTHLGLEVDAVRRMYLSRLPPTGGTDPEAERYEGRRRSGTIRF